MPPGPAPGCWVCSVTGGAWTAGVALLPPEPPAPSTPRPAEGPAGLAGGALRGSAQGRTRRARSRGPPPLSLPRKALQKVENNGLSLPSVLRCWAVSPWGLVLKAPVFPWAGLLVWLLVPCVGLGTH